MNFFLCNKRHHYKPGHTAMYRYRIRAAEPGPEPPILAETRADTWAGRRLLLRLLTVKDFKPNFTKFKNCHEKTKYLLYTKQVVYMRLSIQLFNQLKRNIVCDLHTLI